MSWFGLTDIAKNAISEAQKKIDKVLDIQEQEETNSTKQHGNGGVSNQDINSENSLFDGNSIVPTKTNDKKSSSVVSTGKPKPATLGVSLSQTKKGKKHNKLGVKVAKSPKNKSDASYTQPSITEPSNAFITQPLQVISNRNEASPNESEQSNNSKNILQTSTENISDTAMEYTHTQDKSLTSTPLLPENTSSPTSTNESSEIDILDNSSCTSELSSIHSKQTDTELALQSPVSFVSSQLNLQSDIELLPGSGYSSPPNAEDVQCFNDKMNDFISSQAPIIHDDIKEQSASSELSEDANTQEEVKNDGNRNVPSNENMNNNEPRPLEQDHHSNEGQNTIVEKAFEENESTDMLETNVKDNYESLLKANEKEMHLLNEKLESYESKLFNLSKLNAKLCEDNDNFKSEITILKEDAFQETQLQVQKLEQALNKMESKYNISCEENTNLLKQKKIVETNLASRMSNEQVQQILTEKEDSIKGLLEEGEKLSKQHLQQNNLIKKLKSQLQEKESNLKSTSEKLEAMTSLKNDLQNELKEVKSSDEEYKSTSIRISNAYKEKEDEINQLKEKFSDSEVKNISLQNNLDTAYTEITELNKKLAEKDSQLNSQMLGKETELKQTAEMEIKKLHVEHDHQRELLLLQIMDLNNTIQKNEVIFNRKNDDLKVEIRDFQERLQHGEIRNQELMLSVANATSPLLRQMENLQTSSSTQQRTWIALEKNLNGRLEEAQMQAATLQEKERMAQDHLIETKSSLKSLEQQLLMEKQKFSNCDEQIQHLKSENDNLQKQYNATKIDLKQTHNKYSATVENLKKEKLTLENQLNMEKVRSEADLKKFKTQQEIWKKERERQSWVSRPELQSTTSVSAQDIESVGSGKDSSQILDHSSFEQGLMFSSSNISSSHSYNDFRMSSSTAFENLQSQIKRHEGEIAQLHGEINRLERTRASMAEEIVRLTNENEDLENTVKEKGNVSERLKETETRYNMMLAMYGQKEEENEELRMDLADVKLMYKQQINDLLSPK